MQLILPFPWITRCALQFSLAVLCSSLFVFNSFGAIDEASIKKLSFITQLSKNIHIKASNSGGDNPADFEEFFPHCEPLSLKVLPW